MMNSRIVLSTLFLMLSVSVSAATLNWVLPTETENGYQLQPGDLTAVTLYKNGVVEVVLTGDTISYSAPGECRPGTMWAATSTAFTLESQHSVSIEMPVDEGGCAPKSPAGLSISQ